MLRWLVVASVLLANAAGAEGQRRPEQEIATPAHLREAAFEAVRAALRGANLNPDDWRLDVLEGYIQRPDHAALHSGASGEAATLVGRVLDAKGRAVDGARISAVPASDPSAEQWAYTDPRGDFRIPLLSKGSYRVRVEATPFPPAQHTVEIRLARARMIFILSGQGAPSEQAVGQRLPDGLMTVGAWSGEKMAVFQVMFRQGKAEARWGTSPVASMTSREWEDGTRQLSPVVSLLLDQRGGLERFQELLAPQVRPWLEAMIAASGSDPGFQSKDTLGFLALFLQAQAYSAWAEVEGLTPVIYGEMQRDPQQTEGAAEMAIVSSYLRMVTEGLAQDLQSVGAADAEHDPAMRDYVRRTTWLGWRRERPGEPSEVPADIPPGVSIYLLQLSLRGNSTYVLVGKMNGEWKVFGIGFD